MSKFPFYKQLDGMDCGPSCLRMIAKYYGKTFSVQQLREQSYIQRTGVNLLGISEAAASIGLRATGIRTSMEKLKQQSKLPCIIHWNQEHFVVLYKIEKKRGKTWFYIADPAYGLLKYEEQELKKCWINYVKDAHLMRRYYVGITRAKNRLFIHTNGDCFNHLSADRYLMDRSVKQAMNTVPLPDVPAAVAGLMLSCSNIPHV